MKHAKRDGNGTRERSVSDFYPFPIREHSSGTFRVRPHREKPEQLTAAMLGYSSLDPSSRSARSRSR